MMVFLAAVGVSTVLVGCEEHPLAPATTSAKHDEVYPNYAVACDHHLASRAGADMLAQGGNAVDAAVAASFTLSVVRPQSCGIGGGGFMMLHIPEQAPVFLDYREMCPQAIGPTYYEADDAPSPRYGHHACAVPGTVAGLLRMHETWGSLERADVLAPAIRIAREGWEADATHVHAVGEFLRKSKDRANLQAWAGSLWTDVMGEGEVAVGDRLVNEPQAKALELIAESGTFAFYEGALAEAIAKTVETGGGVLSRRDLRRYRPELRAPVVFESGKHTVYAAPPPSSGGVVIGQIFGVLEAAGVGALAHAGHLHTYIEASKHAFADRAKFLADPSSLDNIQSLLDREVFRARAANIQDLETFPPEHYGTAPTPNEDAGTSHLSVVDANGMAVSCTETINLSWGSCVCVEGFGFMLNDEMDDFTARPGEPNAFGLVQSEANAPQPGNRPLSSMSPTIVLRDGKAVALAGASGGPRIISATSQVLWHMLHGDDPGTAVRRPRIHHQWMPNIVRCEAEIDLTFFDMTTSIGHQTEAVEGRLGICQAIKVTESGVHAACDPGKGGRPAGG